jgi:hypothetical protein
MQPSRQPLKPHGLAAVELRVAVGVVAHEHLGEVRVKRLDVLGEILPELEVELLLARALDGHRQREVLATRRARDVGAELLVDQQPAGLPRRTAGDRPREAFVDERLQL